MALVDKLPSGCWYWTGSRSRGAGNKKYVTHEENHHRKVSRKKETGDG
jgi:hypothetical protein